jgi:lauroyl/myristoyl acyltransferase
VSGWEHVEAAEAAGGGILFITPHLGCFEITAQYFSTHKPITVLYRAPKKAVLQPSSTPGAAAATCTSPPPTCGVRRLIKALRPRGGRMLPDQVPGSGEGAWLPFFGRPAYTMTLAARLSEVAGVTTLFAWAERLPGGAGFHLHLRPALTPLAGDTEPAPPRSTARWKPRSAKTRPSTCGATTATSARRGARRACAPGPKTNPSGHPMSRIVVALLWLLHWLPLSLQAPIGRAIGLLLYVIIAPRRRVVHTNLRLCFPSSPRPSGGPSPGSTSRWPGAASSSAAWPGSPRPSASGAWSASRAKTGSGNWWKRASR